MVYHDRIETNLLSFLLLYFRFAGGASPPLVTDLMKLSVRLQKRLRNTAGKWETLPAACCFAGWRWTLYCENDDCLTRFVCFL